MKVEPERMEDKKETELIQKKRQSLVFQGGLPCSTAQTMQLEGQTGSECASTVPPAVPSGLWPEQKAPFHSAVIVHAGSLSHCNVHWTLEYNRAGITDTSNTCVYPANTCQSICHPEVRIYCRPCVSLGEANKLVIHVADSSDGLMHKYLTAQFSDWRDSRFRLDYRVCLYKTH